MIIAIIAMNEIRALVVRSGISPLCVRSVYSWSDPIGDIYNDGRWHFISVADPIIIDNIGEDGNVYADEVGGDNSDGDSVFHFKSLHSLSPLTQFNSDAPISSW